MHLVLVHTLSSLARRAHIGVEVNGCPQQRRHAVVRAAFDVEL